MAIIQVPKPPRSAWDPNRPVSTLLQSQVEHLFEAERKLPHKYKTQIYISAIKTEGEAADYIQKVTEAIHRAHEDAAAMRAKRTTKGRRGIAIAAVAAGPRSGTTVKRPKNSTSKTKTKVQPTKLKSAAAKAGRKK